MFTRLRQDDRGMLISAEMILAVAFLLSGTAIGIGSISDALVERMAEPTDIDEMSVTPGDALSYSIVVRDSNAAR